MASGCLKIEKDTWLRKELASLRVDKTKNIDPICLTGWLLIQAQFGKKLAEAAGERGKTR